MKWRQIVIIAVVVLAIIAGSWWAFQPQPIGVDIAVLEEGVLTVTVDDEGLAQIRDTYQISTPIAGAAQRIPIHVGDHVEPNAVVATVVPQLSGFLDQRSLVEAEAAVKAVEVGILAARNDVAGAEAELAFWQDEADRSEHLLERGLITQQAYNEVQFQLDRRNTLLKNAKAALSLSNRQLEQAQARLLEPNGSSDRATTYDIRAPEEGQVLSIANESSRNLPAGAELMTIGNPRDLEIVVDILSTDAVRIDIGAAATIDGWGRDEVLEAEVRRIEPIGFTKISALGIEEQRVRVHLDINSDPEIWQTLGHLYRVFVRIETQRIDNTILVPTAALFRQNGAWSVFVYQDGLAELRRVGIGPRDSGYASIINGLSADEHVILHPNDQIIDGSFVVDRALLQE